MKEKRRHGRRSEALRMSLESATGIRRTLVARDVSEGGIFLLALNPDQLPVGTEVTLWPAKVAGGAQPQIIKGRVVRVSDQGMGIEFTEPAFSVPSTPAGGADSGPEKPGK